MAKTRTNLLTNGDFEADPVGSTTVTGWSLASGSTIEVVDSSTVAPYVGTKCLKITRGSADASALSDYVPCLPGERITLLGMNRRATASSVAMYIEFATAGSTAAIASSFASGGSLITDSWVGGGTSRIAPPEAARFRVRIHVSGASGVAYFDNIRVYKDAPTLSEDVWLDDDIAVDAAPYRPYVAGSVATRQATGGPISNGPYLEGTRDASNGLCVLGAPQAIPPGTRKVDANAWIKLVGGTGASTVEARVYFYNPSGNYLTSILIGSTTNTTWTAVSAPIAVPSLAAYCLMGFIVNGGAAGARGDFFPGRITFQRRELNKLPDGLGDYNPGTQTRNASLTRNTLAPGGLLLQSTSRDTNAYLPVRQFGTDDTTLMNALATRGTAIFRFRPHEALTPTTGGFKRLAIVRGGTGTSTLNFTWGWDPQSSDGRLRFSVRNSVGGSHKKVYALSRTYSKDQSYFFASAWDGTAQPYLWVEDDAVQRGEAVTDGPTGIANNGARLLFGTDLAEAGTASTLHSTVEAFLLYDRVLSDAEIAQIRTGQPPPTTGLLVWYKFRETRNTRRKGIIDSSGNFRTGATTDRSITWGRVREMPEFIGGTLINFADYPDKDFNGFSDQPIGFEPRIGAPVMMRTEISAAPATLKILNGKLRCDSGPTDTGTNYTARLRYDLESSFAHYAGARRLRLGGRLKRSNVVCAFPNGTYQKPSIQGRGVGGYHSNTTAIIAMNMDSYPAPDVVQNVEMSDADFVDFHRDHTRTAWGDTGTSSVSGPGSMGRWANHNNFMVIGAGNAAMRKGISEWETLYALVDQTILRPLFENVQLGNPLPNTSRTNPRTVLKR